MTFVVSILPSFAWRPAARCVWSAGLGSIDSFKKGVDFTYLSKIENGKAGYFPGADTLRALAEALEADVLELLELADKVPPEIERFAGNARARRFLQRAQEIASPDDWDALLNVLEERQKGRSRRKKE